MAFRSSQSWLPVKIVFARNEDKMIIRTSKPMKVRLSLKKPFDGVWCILSEM